MAAAHALPIGLGLNAYNSSIALAGEGIVVRIEGPTGRQLKIGGGSR